VFVPPPDLRAREEILKVHTRDKPLSPDIDLKRVAQHSSGLTGADLGNLCNEAAIQAGRAQRSFISQADFDNAFERVVAGLQSRKVITDDEKRVVAWHEAGHALVSELLPTVDKVQKVSIVPRGKALGYTLNLPQEDRYLKSRQELIDYMKVLLGGRVAEQITEVCSVPWRACRQSDVFGKQQPIAPKTHNLAQQVSFRIDADIGGEHLAEVALQVLTAHRAESVDSVGVQPTHKGTERPKR